MAFTPAEIELVLRAIREDKPFRTKFGQTADEVLDKVYTYFSNPNCSCKAAIIDWTMKNETKTRDLINTFSDLFEKYKQNPAPTVPAPTAQQQAQRPPTMPNQTVPAAQQSMTPTPANVKIGETLAIDPTPAAYKKLFETIKSERWVFRGIQVIPGEDNGKEVWFILFY